MSRTRTGWDRYNDRRYDRPRLQVQLVMESGAVRGTGTHFVRADLAERYALTILASIARRKGCDLQGRKVAAVVAGDQVWRIADWRDTDPHVAR